jgi:hypothetical protein
MNGDRAELKGNRMHKRFTIYDLRFAIDD